MKINLKMIYLMEKVYLHGKMVKNTKEILKKELKKEKGYISQ